MKTEGAHNVSDALAAMGAASALGLDMEQAAASVCAFRGVRTG